MAAYKLTLTKTDTGDVLVDEEIDCLIGATCDNDGKMGKLLYSSSSLLPLASANAGVLDLVKRLETEHPEIKGATEMISAIIHLEGAPHD